MDNSTIIILTETIVLALASLFALALGYKRELMMLQLNSYRNERYVRWFNSSNENTSNLRIGSCIALFLLLVYNLPFYATSIVAIGILLWIIISLAIAKYKKPLVWTNRARRIYLTMWIVTLLALAVMFGFSFHASPVESTVMWTDVVQNEILVLLLLYVVSPIVILCSNWLLKPIERRINDKYVNEASDILRQMPDLKIIGITGSYGKTSTKHYLNRILSEKFDVLMTPGSFNTTMGVVRTVREYLKPYNEVFIVEMGAKQPGDIKEICDLVHPTIGIVTAVGEQHLESFKTIENIQKTKFELIDALPSDGFGVVNDDFEYVANRKVADKKCLRYAVQNKKNADYIAKDIILDHTGTSFTVSGEGHELRLHTKLVGECNISNLMAAVIVALRLGVDENKIRYAVEKIDQVEHRLNMKRTPGGVTIIDDAFNSNPTGSRMALEVLGAMKSGKRIVVTPGMIELGDKQYELNKQLGINAAKNADIAIVVNQYNRQPIVDGLIEGGMPEENIITVDSFNEAQKHLASILKAGDTVLYENDLPDTFK